MRSVCHADIGWFTCCVAPDGPSSSGRFQDHQVLRDLVFVWDTHSWEIQGYRKADRAMQKVKENAPSRQRHLSYPGSMNAKQVVD